MPKPNRYNVIRIGAGEGPVKTSTGSDLMKVERIGEEESSTDAHFIPDGENVGIGPHLVSWRLNLASVLLSENANTVGVPVSEGTYRSVSWCACNLCLNYLIFIIIIYCVSCGKLFVIHLLLCIIYSVVYIFLQ